jgi:hypothetical protein
MKEVRCSMRLERPVKRVASLSQVGLQVHFQMLYRVRAFLVIITTSI